MEGSRQNIYQIARKTAGFTQEKAAELLCVSVESVRAYETGKTVPPNDIVCHMIEVYNAQFLAYQHLLYNNEVARRVFPAIDIKEMPSAILRLQKEVTDFMHCREELTEIGYDGKITPEERPRYNAIMKELKDIIAAVIALDCVKA